MDRKQLAIKAIETTREALAARALRDRANEQIIALQFESTPVFWSACNAYDTFDRQWLDYTKRQEWAMVEFCNSFSGYQVNFGNYLTVARKIAGSN